MSNFSNNVLLCLCMLRFLSFVFVFLAYSPASACSRVLSANNGQAVLVGRNMD